MTTGDASTAQRLKGSLQLESAAAYNPNSPSLWLGNPVLTRKAKSELFSALFKLHTTLLTACTID